MQNKKYFSAIATQLNNGGYEALMHYLMNYKYDEADLRDVPKTEALLEQKLQSLNHEQQWWLEVLQKEGYPSKMAGQAYAARVICFVITASMQASQAAAIKAHKLN